MSGSRLLTILHQDPPIELPMLEIIENIAPSTATSKKPTTTAMPMIRVGSIRLVITRKAMFSSFS